jgi:hypothetical protein
MSSSISKGWSHPIHKGVLNPFQRDGWSHPFKSIHFHSIIKDSTFVAKKLLLECWCFSCAWSLPSLPLEVGFLLAILVEILQSF